MARQTYWSMVSWSNIRLFDS